MHLDTPTYSPSLRLAKMLVINADDEAASLMSTRLPHGACEVIVSHDLAFAEVATELIST